MLCGLAFFAQFHEVISSAPENVRFPHNVRISLNSGGVLAEWCSVHLGEAGWLPMHFYPWWQLIGAWGVITVVVWFLTRRHKVIRGFPVEPAGRKAEA
jgi:hypothetical protein